MELHGESTSDETGTKVVKEFKEVRSVVVRCRDGGEEADFVFRVLARGPRVRVIGTFGGRLVVCGEGVRRVCNNHAYASRDESCLRVVVRLLDRKSVV